MGRKRVIFLVFLLIISLVQVSLAVENFVIKTIDIVFEVKDTNKVNQQITYKFSKSSYQESVEYVFNEHIENVKVEDQNQSLEYEISRTDDDKNILKIYLVKPTDTLIISYEVEGIIFQNSRINHFFTEFNYPKNVANLNAKVILPIGYVLYEQGIPAKGVSGSDGERIIIEWKKITINPVVFSIKFIKSNQLGYIWIGFILILLLILTSSFVYLIKKNKKNILFGFRDDEKKTIQYISKNKKILQKDLQKEFGFSRAKATRIVKKLEEKKLITREYWGRTNKLTWKGNPSNLLKRSK